MRAIHDPATPAAVLSYFSIYHPSATERHQALTSFASFSSKTIDFSFATIASEEGARYRCHAAMARRAMPRTSGADTAMRDGRAGAICYRHVHGAMAQALRQAQCAAAAALVRRHSKERVRAPPRRGRSLPAARDAHDAFMRCQALALLLPPPAILMRTCHLLHPLRCQH